jgi:hypothetical protein
VSTTDEWVVTESDGQAAGQSASADASASAGAPSVIKAVLKNEWTGEYRFYEDRREVGRLVGNLAAQRGSIEAGGLSCEFQRQGLRGPMVLMCGGRPVAVVREPHTRARVYHISIAKRELILRQVSPTGRRYLLLEGDRTIGAVAPELTLRSNASLDLPADIPLVIRLFFFVLVLLYWRSQDHPR